VYSIKRLALAGPGVSVQQVSQAGLLYHYSYQGLRLLITQSGTYYLLPVGWNPHMDITYIINPSDQIRVEMLSGAVRTNG
jgi:hypothetical protein